MTNKDILRLAQHLPFISPPDMDRWFNYAVAETLQRAKAKAETIKDVVKPTGKMEEYQTKLKELQEKHAEKDEYDKPIKDITQIGNGRQYEEFVIPEIDNPKGKFNVAVKKLESTYKAAIDAHDETLKFLDDENKDFVPYWVTIDQVPNGLSHDEFKTIFLMLEKPKKNDK